MSGKLLKVQSDRMKEIRIHGIGGQGVITLADLIAVAAFKDGKYSQAFPFFGVERRGAPVTSFARIDNKFIRKREHVYNPDYVLVLDSSLINKVDVADGLKDNGLIIINSSDSVDIKTNSEVRNIDLTKIALDIFDKPFVNSPMLGAFIKITKEISINSTMSAINERFPEKIASLNNKALKKVHEVMK